MATTSLPAHAELNDAWQANRVDHLADWFCQDYANHEAWIDGTWLEQARQFISLSMEGIRNRQGRAYISTHAHLHLSGLRIHEMAGDDRPMARNECDGGALFNIRGDFGTVTLERSHVRSTENGIGFGSRVYGRVRFGHTHFYREENSPRSVIYAVKRHTGWCFAGAGGVVSASGLNKRGGEKHTYLHEGVEFEQSPSILYLT